MKNILVIGDTILDEYIYINPQKVSDEAHVITSNIIDKKYSLGGGANVARNVGSQTAKCTYIGLCSKETKKFIVDEFKKYNVDFKLFNSSNSIQVKTRIISTRGSQICRYDSNIDPNVSYKIYEEILKILKQEIKKFDFIIISKYYDFFLNEEFIKKIIEIAKINNIKIIVDNRQANINIFKNVDFYKMNFNEFRNVFNDQKINNDFKSIKYKLISENIFKKNNINYLILTRSNLSTIVFNAFNNEVFEIPVTETKVKDVSGAGDTFVATFAINYIDDQKIINTINICHLICNIVVKKLGTDVVWSYEFNNDISLDIISKQLKFNNKKIIFTNGVFDILHEGHIKILREAKKFGDYLIVGINSDKSVKQLKGSDRPIKNQNERKLILESIKFVDKVIIFDELTVDNILKQLKPNVYVKGGDYSINNLPEKKSLKYVNQVEFIDLVKNKSSTSFIKKIRKDKE